MLSVFGVYTREANEDALKHTTSKMNISTLSGDPIRMIQRDFVQTAYALTNDRNEDTSEIKLQNLSRVQKF